MHDRQVAGHFQGQFVTFFTVQHSRRTGRLRHIGRDARHLFGRCEVSVGVGGVECVFAELLAQLCAALLNLRKALTGSTLQLGTAKHEVAHGVGVGLALLGVEAGRVHGLVFGIQALVRT